jgi:hypothetical protein
MPPTLPLGYIFEPERTPKIRIQDPDYPKMANTVHNTKVRELEDALKRSESFNQVLPFHTYSKNGLCGEIDVLAMGPEPEWYEVKYRHTPSNLAKAISSFDKFKRAFPEFNGRAYYVSCNGIVIEITNIEPESREELPKRPSPGIIITTYK